MFLYWLLGIIVLPGIILGAIAEIKVHSAYSKMSKVHTQRGITSNQIARETLDNNDLQDIQLTTTNKTLGDYYDPTKKIIALSPGVNNDSTIAGIGIAMHEVGHAIQDKQNYAFSKLRKFLVPVINFCSMALWPLVIIGLIFNLGAASNSIIGNVFLWSGIIFFGSSVIFSLVTLPTEFDASRRAIKVLKDSNYFTDEEIKGAKKVLSAAAMTYVASLLVAILNFLRFLLTVLALRDR